MAAPAAVAKLDARRLVRRRTGERRQQTTTAPAASPSTERLVRRRTGACRGRRASLSRTGTQPDQPDLAAEARQSGGERRKRGHIPAAVRRAVWRRYGAACCYRDPHTGMICGSTHLLQIDHIVPWALGRE